MEDAYKLEGGVIVLNRELTELDEFVRAFLEILKKHSDYLIVSGYVSIASGRARGTEDIDVLVKVMGKEKFKRLYNDLIDKGFWCIQGDCFEEAFECIEEKTNIRFARDKEWAPNVEFVPIDESKKIQYFEYTHPQKMRVENFEFKVPPIEFEILYKEIRLGSDKDIADAKHLRTIFSEILKEEKFKEYEEVIK